MRETRMQRVARRFALAFLAIVIAGCGRPYATTIKAPTDISNYNAIRVAWPVVSSVEQTSAAMRLNAKFSERAKEEMTRALKRNGKYSLLESDSLPPNALIVDTKIDIKYGSRRQRYMSGYGAGTGNVVIDLVLKDASSNEVKLEMTTRGQLAVGAFGGSMDKTVVNAIKKAVKEFVAKL